MDYDREWSDWDEYLPDGLEDPDDDMEIDVCTACGRYFEWTDHLEHKAGRQHCLPCIRGYTPPHEY